jgi:histidyl-tRNA synthetase
MFGMRFKGLDESTCRNLESVLLLRESSSRPTVDSLFKSKPKFKSNPLIEQGLSELQQFTDFLKCFDISDKIAVDLRLARGLEYYTGIIFEVVSLDSSLGSIAAGGRYDNLIGRLSGTSIPSVGFSLGIECILTLLESRETTRSKDTQVLVASTAPKLLTERMKLCGQLWRAGIASEFLPDEDPYPRTQIDFARTEKIPYIVWIIPKKETVNLKNVETHEQITVQREALVGVLRQCLNLTLENNSRMYEKRALEAEQRLESLSNRISLLEIS